MVSKGFSVFVNIGGKLLPSFGGAIRSAEAQVKGLARVAAVHARTVGTIHRAAGAVSTAGKKMQDAGGRLIAAATPMALLGAGVAKSVYDFDKYANGLQAVTEMTRAQRLEMEKLARAQKYFTPVDAMKSMEELGKTGFTTDQIAGVISPTLKMAKAGGIGAQEGTDIATNVMKSMRLPMETARQAEQSMTRVGDVMSYVANKTNTDFAKLGDTFKFVGPAAASVGADLETIAAMSGKMADFGIRGSEAGVALRSAFIRMVRPTKPAIAALARLNVRLADFVTQSKNIDAGGVVKSLQAQGIDASKASGVIQKILNDPNAKFDVSQTVSRITDAITKSMGAAGGAMDRDVIASGITDALIGAADKIDFAGFLAKLKEKGASLGDLAAIFQSQHAGRMQTLMEGDLAGSIADTRRNARGYMERAFETRMQGVVGTVARLDSAFFNLTLTLSKTGVLDTVSSAFERLADGLDRLGKLNPSLLKFGTYAGLAAIALGPLMMAGGLAMRGLAGLGRGLMLIGAAATTGLAARLVKVAAGIRGVVAATMLGGAGRLAKMALGLRMLFGLGAGAGLAAIAGGIGKLGAAILLFPLRALRGIGIAMAGLLLNPVGIALTAIVAGLAALGTWIANNWSGLKNFFEGFANGFRDALPPSVASAIEGVASSLSSITSAISGILGPLNATEEQWRQWGNSAGKAVGEAVTAVTELPGKIAAVAGQFASSMSSMAQAGYSAFLSIDWTGLGAAIVNAIVSGIKSMASSLISTLSNLASQAASSVKGAFSFGGVGGAAVAGARAAGGPVRGGKTYLVGERGPELFTAGYSGRILSNGALKRAGSLGNGRTLPATDDLVSAVRSRQAASKGDFSPTFHITVQGGDGQDSAKRIRREVEAVLDKYQRQQTGALSD